MPTIDNPEIIAWYVRENARDVARDAQTLTLTVAYAAQLIFYYKLWDDAIDKRDEVIDKQKGFLDYLLEKDLGVDVPMMKTKQSVLGLAVPAPDVCGDASRMIPCAIGAGKAVDEKADHQARMVCGGMPDNWYFGEGALLGARAGSYAGGVLANSGKRREEQFREQKTKLTLRAQATSRMNAGPILSGYEQASSIQEGLAQIFAKGFNSAGVGLGTQLNRLASGSGAMGGVA